MSVFGGNFLLSIVLEEGGPHWPSRVPSASAGKHECVVSCSCSRSRCSGHANAASLHSHALLQVPLAAAADAVARALSGEPWQPAAALAAAVVDSECPPVDGYLLKLVAQVTPHKPEACC